VLVHVVVVLPCHTRRTNTARDQITSKIVRISLVVIGICEGSTCTGFEETWRGSIGDVSSRVKADRTVHFVVACYA
jgi:hypothetical protein